MKKIYIFGGLILLVLLIVIGLSLATTYELYHVREKDGCKLYYKECVCVGLLRTLESYPPQFKCVGFGSCTDIDNRVECE